MRKETVVRWYVAAWIVWCLAFLALLALGRMAPRSSTPPPGTFVLYFVMFVAAIVTFLMWVVALVKLGSRRLWAWFVTVLVLHLVGIGIVGIAAYGLAGPNDSGGEEIVYRPTAT
jgi:energy-coupling factor transporter transmembrane protein EcfT